MRKRLKRLYIITYALTTVFALAGMMLLTNMKISDTQANLRVVLETSSAWVLESPSSLQEMADAIADVSPPLRVTFLHPTGLVLADSQADPLTLAVHSDRPEIIAAMEGEIGEAFRLSDTQATISCYAAKQLSPVLILRLSYPLTEVLTLLGSYLGALALLFAALYLAQRYTISRVADRVMQQMDEINLLLEGKGGASAAVYPEFQPAMDHIAYLVSRLQSDLAEVTRTARLRTDFVANASHELRSPLTSIMGFAEMLSEGFADTPEEQALCLSTIQTECKRMLGVIEDILLQSKAERAPDQPLLPVDAGAVAREIILALSPQAARKNISMAVTGEGHYLSYEKALWEILYNLSDNAIRYGRENGRVDILLEEDRIVVQDDGVGVQPEHIPYLFEPFYRVDETRDMRAGGTGLGLSIVRTLARQCGGDVTVESQHGVGSRFIITLKKEADAC